jgi:hypothetical protein
MTSLTGRPAAAWNPAVESCRRIRASCEGRLGPGQHRLAPRLDPESDCLAPRQVPGARQTGRLRQACAEAVGSWRAVSEVAGFHPGVVADRAEGGGRVRGGAMPQAAADTGVRSRRDQVRVPALGPGPRADGTVRWRQTDPWQTG